MAPDVSRTVSVLSFFTITHPEDPVAIDPFLLSILVCPQCRGPLTLSEEPAGLACSSCHLLYPVKDDIPVMLVEEALPVAEGRP